MPARTFSAGDVGQVLSAAARHRDVRFIVGHSGGYGRNDFPGAITDVPNAHLDVCASCADAGRIEAFVGAAGGERVL